MKGSEFLKKLKVLAERKGWFYEWRPDEGKGSHGALYVNGQKTIVRNLQRRIKNGKLSRHAQTTGHQRKRAAQIEGHHENLRLRISIYQRR